MREKIRENGEKIEKLQNDLAYSPGAVQRAMGRTSGTPGCISDVVGQETQNAPVLRCFPHGRQVGQHPWERSSRQSVAARSLLLMPSWLDVRSSWPAVRVIRPRARSGSGSISPATAQRLRAHWHVRAATWMDSERRRESSVRTKRGCRGRLAGPSLRTLRMCPREREGEGRGEVGKARGRREREKAGGISSDGGRSDSVLVS
ncbi:hypothetical protein C8T65DRAFT_692401 [Cerioporus squamosus]|nr:hypothetical protein C8T65DRAFT_692401 [Cerioporus squamosus]